MKIKYPLLIVAGLILASSAGAQIHMLRNYDLARSIASKSGRLIVMDFWASWCRPCKDMDVELWQNPATQKFATYFVGVRIDVEAEENLVKRYRASSIPKVIIATVNGDIIWEQEGYDEAATYMLVFEDLPSDVTELNKQLQIIAANKNDLQANYSAGLEFQRLGKVNNNSKLKNSFLKNSEVYLQKAIKLSTDSLLTKQIELKSLANKELLNQPDK
ncbi:MAG: thioredoxin family protein [Bacteroidales bacterium]|nr:thioredoxin family protein [Bacteroidales bacterium]